MIGIAQFIVVLVLLELFGRAFDPLGVSYFPETARFLDTMIMEEPIGYRLQPGLDGRFHNANYNVNSLGFRGSDILIPKPTNERRILWLGDSAVFGIGVDNDNTIPAVVESLANSSGTDLPRISVLNMGVPSYNSEQELIQFETLGLRLEPDAVLLLFSPNDIEPKNWVFDKRASVPADLAQRSYALSLLFAGYRAAGQAIASPVHSISMDDYAPGNPRWLAIERSLTRIKQLCDERKLPFAVLLFGNPEERYASMVTNAGRANGFVVISIQPSLDPRWRDAASPKYVNSSLDSHCNPTGCKMWGQAVYEALESKGWFKR